MTDPIVQSFGIFVSFFTVQINSYTFKHRYLFFQIRILLTYFQYFYLSTFRIKDESFTDISIFNFQFELIKNNAKLKTNIMLRIFRMSILNWFFPRLSCCNVMSKSTVNFINSSFIFIPMLNMFLIVKSYLNIFLFETSLAS